MSASTLHPGAAAALLCAGLCACRTPPDTSPPSDTGPWDRDGDGWVHREDCDDGDPDAHPGAAETCDGRDQDCDGEVDDGLLTTWYPDGDGDGAGHSAVPIRACAQPPGTTASGGDCDDGDPDVHPGAAEICDERDQDCDGAVDEGVQTTYWTDADADGWGDEALPVQACSPPAASATTAGDCDDGDPAIHPGAAEVCDGRDQDCDGGIDEGVQATYWADADADGWGNPAWPTQACAPDVGLVSNDGDCDDHDAAVHPGAPETCDGRDEDCDGDTDEGCVHRARSGGP